MVAFFALAVALFLFGMIVLVIDLSFEFEWSTRVSAAAQLAAQSGANSVNAAFLYSGGRPGAGDPSCGGNVGILDTCRDLRACQDAGDRSARIGASDRPASGTTCRNTGGGTAVHADVTKVISLPIGLFGTTVVVRGSFDAAPLAGACAVAVSGAPAPCPG
jgi:hypothetical protein